MASDPHVSEAQQTLSDIIRGMQHAVNTAQEILQDHQFELLSRYFDDDGHPHMVHVKTPDGQVVNIPVITLIPQNTLTIKELEMDFAVRIASSELKSFHPGKEDNSQDSKNRKSSGAASDSVQRSSFNVFFSGLGKKHEEAKSEKNASASEEDTDVVRIKIQFVATEETEASARIREMLYKQIG